MAALMISDCQQLHVKVKVSVRGDDSAGTMLAVPQAAGDMQNGTFAQAHVLHAKVPAIDDLAHADCELEGHVAVSGGIEFVATIRKRAGVVHRKLVPLLREGLTVAGRDDLELQSIAKVRLCTWLEAEAKAARPKRSTTRLTPSDIRQLWHRGSSYDQMRHRTGLQAPGGGEEA
eukprot:CAMPEP_0115295360 /NCGR_PEP_ID=MMETSP0270-20121206/66669_1 /TAXON_ID=71861 /ORGANISM="Scrippsiella trochoidea, Strain CCMP3099" /LENGTH=173 /DNA_ID=CAMNT_0002712937 /DNA_START=130 /DNA_END=648 /DNA_ORIENTATION=+